MNTEGQTCAAVMLAFCVFAGEMEAESHTCFSTYSLENLMSMGARLGASPKGSMSFRIGAASASIAASGVGSSSNRFQITFRTCANQLA